MAGKISLVVPVRVSPEEITIQIGELSTSSWPSSSVGIS